MRTWIVGLLGTVLALSAIAGVGAQEEPSPPETANVEVTVWRSVADPSLLYISTRPADGSWRTLDVPLNMSALSRSGNFHQSNTVLVAVPLEAGGTANVEVTVWRRVSDPTQLYVSTRPADGSWRTLDTALDMSALSRSGNFHQSNAVLVAVPLQTPPPAARDRAVLVALYYATNGDGWRRNDNWLTNAPLNEWYGVQASSDGRVLVLDLQRNSLDGDIPPELGNLPSLETLHLGGNALSGAIPPELGSLSRLRLLSVSGNELSGELPPELGNLSNLRLLDLSGNEWTGEIPPELGSLSNLQALYLAGNQLTGCVPDELLGVERHGWPPLCADAVGLTALYNATGGRSWENGARGWLKGPVAEWHGVEVSSNGRVVELDLSDNGLDGEIPAELAQLSALEGLDLGDNNLTGEIPPELGNLSKLERLRLWGNELHGKIPAELASLSRLTSLSLSGNQLSGEIPAELAGLPRLTSLSLGGNELSGEIPAELGNLSRLRWLALGGNQLSGEIPPELGNLLRVTDIDLSSNRLTGPIPPGIGNLHELYSLELDNNRLSGEIPAEMGSLLKLHRLYLNDNQLSGEIPSAFGALPALEYFRLANNQVTGCVPVGPSLRLGDRYFGDLQPCPTSE